MLDASCFMAYASSTLPQPVLDANVKANVDANVQFFTRVGLAPSRRFRFQSDRDPSRLKISRCCPLPAARFLFSTRDLGLGLGLGRLKWLQLTA